MIYRKSLVPLMIIACALFGQAAIPSAAERPCRADIEKFCADVSRGSGRVAECLRQHQSELSPECKARGKEMRERIREAHEECKADISKYCGDVQPGKGHIVSCLRSHDKDLSSECRAAMKPAR